LLADFCTGDFSRFSLFSERLPVHFQIVSRLFEVEGFHRLIDALELCGAGHFEAPGNVFGFFEAPCFTIRQCVAETD